MSDRPSDGMGLDELREEFDWISEFQSRMAERICGDADVHNLVDYVGKLEAENAKLRELVGDMWTYITEPVGKRNNLKERLARLDDIGDRMRELGVEL